MFLSTHAFDTFIRSSELRGLHRKEIGLISTPWEHGITSANEDINIVALVEGAKLQYAKMAMQIDAAVYQHSVFEIPLRAEKKYIIFVS